MSDGTEMVGLGTCSGVAAEQDFGLDNISGVPLNSQNAMKWAFTIWKSWRMWRNFQSLSRQDTHWPIPSLHEDDLDHLDYWLGRFISEVRSKDGTPYAPRKF